MRAGRKQWYATLIFIIMNASGCILAFGYNEMWVLETRKDRDGVKSIFFTEGETFVYVTLLVIQASLMLYNGGKK